MARAVPDPRLADTPALRRVTASLATREHDSECTGSSPVQARRLDHATRSAVA